MPDKTLASATAAGAAPVPAWWTSREGQIQGFTDKKVVKGKVAVLAVSPGGRPVRSVSYGEPEPELRGAANFNSAVASGDVGAFYKREQRKRPVLVIVGGIHGQEMEGMMGVVSLLSLMETGKDLMGAGQPGLLEKMQKLRLIAIPLANPDGRARVPYDGWSGLPLDEMTKWGQGTRKDGTPYGWPHCKAVHPMAGDVGLLGGYYDDAGVNINHDRWDAPMSTVTKSLLEIAHAEGPDMFLNLHGHGANPEAMPARYLPGAAKREFARFSHGLHHCLRAKGYPCAIPSFFEENSPAMGPAFNLDCMMFHSGAAMPVTFECPQGLTCNKRSYSYEDTLNIHHALFEYAADFLTGV